MMAAMLVAAELVKPLAKRFYKTEVTIVASLLSSVINIALYFIRPENVWVFVGFQTISYLGLGMFTMVSWALITDVIDYSEIKNGVCEDATVYALYSFARKIGQAASAGLTCVLLEMVGYSAATRGEISVQNGIFNITVLVPALEFILLAIVLWF